MLANASEQEAQEIAQFHDEANESRSSRKSAEQEIYESYVKKTVHPDDIDKVEQGIGYNQNMIFMKTIPIQNTLVVI